MGFPDFDFEVTSFVLINVIVVVQIGKHNKETETEKSLNFRTSKQNENRFTKLRGIPLKVRAISTKVIY